MMEIDYNLVDEGFVMTNEYIVILLDGTFHCIDDRSFEGSHRSTKQMPYYNTGLGSFQIFISEYTATTFLKAAETIGLMDIETRVPFKLIDEMLPEFKAAFGAINDVKIVANPAPSFQTVKLNKNAAAEIYMLFDMHIKNPLYAELHSVAII